VLAEQPGGHGTLYAAVGRFYTFRVTFLRPIKLIAATASLVSAGFTGIWAQEPTSSPQEAGNPAAESRTETPELPFQIRLLETHIRFEVNGDSRKAVHTVVKINNALGARQFARISFDYNRSFQQVEIPLVLISHANGGTSELLPSAVTDAPNPAVEQYPAYQDVRVKSVRILGLQEGDTIEYRVISVTTKYPLAPDFWLEHSFDRSGQVVEEHYDLDLPATRQLDLRINPTTPPTSKDATGAEGNYRSVYHWSKVYSAPKEGSAAAENAETASLAPDVALSTLSWELLATRLAELMLPGPRTMPEAKRDEHSSTAPGRQYEVTGPVRDRALSLTRDSRTVLDRLKTLYEFVSTKIATVDIPFGATGFRARSADEVLSSGYGDGEDKYVLLANLGAAVNLRVDPALTGFCDKSALPLPTIFKHLVVTGTIEERWYWMDPAVEVAPFGMISPSPAKCALRLRRAPLAMNSGPDWMDLPAELPFAAFQTVSVDAALSNTGQLSAKVKYTLRGPNELLLRVAFHQTPKEKWKEVANLLSLSDGFRGQVSSVEASDPMATKEPFTVEYQLTQPKFVDWAKKPVRIPALLPQIGLPDPPVKGGPGEAVPEIELGTPLEVQTSLTLRLPPGTVVQTPAGTAVTRDYATFASKYSATQNTVTASRHINFLMREIPGERALDYNAFLRSVQNDQAQFFTLVPPTGPGKLDAKP
jgi:hypothetical protein